MFRFVHSFIIVQMLILTAGSVLFAETAELTVPEDGSYIYWFDYSGVEGRTERTTPASLQGKKTTISLPLVKDKVPEGKLYILNNSTGNEAILEVGKKQNEFVLRDSDFDTVRRIRLYITAAANDLPVASALVTVNVKTREDSPVVRKLVLDPSAEGIVELTDIPAGSGTVLIEYGDGKKASQDIEISLDRKEPVSAIDVPVAGEVETVRPLEETSGNEGTVPARRSPVFPTGGFSTGTVLIGIVLLVVILYAAYAILKNRGATLSETLKKAGVDLPEDQGAGTSVSPPGTDPTICPFCGGKKDPSTGACACTIGSKAAPTGVTGYRLVAVQGPHMGSIFPISAEEMMIGREASNPISLPGDNAISRRHAQVVREGDNIKLVDADSSNGTFVNGVRIKEQILKPGDEIQIGNTRLRFEE